VSAGKTEILSASLVAPMDQPAIPDGAVAIAGGLILAVGTRRHILSEYPGVIEHELSDAVLLPGLVNPHTHLELSDLTPGKPPASFVDWILSLLGRTPRLGEDAAKKIAQAVEIGVRQCLRFGVTTAGDISKMCMFTRPALRSLAEKGHPLRVISFGELQAMAQRRVLFDERFAVATDASQESGRLIVGISPHAPYTVEPMGYRRSLSYAQKENRQLATHLAENPEEAEFLAEHCGPFHHLWEAGVKAWDNDVPKFPGGPIRFARELGLLDFPSLLAHVNYCDDDELALLAAGKASVVYCPRTHAFFGHTPHRWRDMLAKGINVAVGTDSCASSPDLNLVDDLRLLHRLAPDFPAAELWQMATLRAARALRLENDIGSLTPGKRADLVAFRADGADPLARLLETDWLPLCVWIDGKITVWPD